MKKTTPTQPWVVAMIIAVVAAIAVGYLISRTEMASLRARKSAPNAATYTAPQGQPRQQHDEASPRVLGQLPPFALIDQNGDQFGTVQLHGKIWIASFIFTRCPAACPMLLSRKTQLRNDLRKHPAWDDIRLISFSVDPEYDTPEILQIYAQQNQADQEHWRFLTGTRDQIWQLSKEGFKLPVGENPSETGAPVLHSSKLVLVDRTGRIRGYYDGLSEQGVDKVKLALNQIQHEPGPAANIAPLAK